MCIGIYTIYVHFNGARCTYIHLLRCKIYWSVSWTCQNILLWFMCLIDWQSLEVFENFCFCRILKVYSDNHTSMSAINSGSSKKSYYAKGLDTPSGTLNQKWSTKQFYKPLFVTYIYWKLLHLQQAQVPDNSSLWIKENTKVVSW